MALAQEKVDLNRLLFLEQVKREQGLDLILTLIKSELFEVVVFSQDFLPARNLDAQLRKISLLAEESGTFLCLLSPSSTASFGVHIRVETEDAEAIGLQKVKGGSL